MHSDAAREAIAAFPELAQLADLREAGWTFTVTAESGQLVDVRGVVVWPGGWADALKVRAPTDAAGVRVDQDGGVVWRREGGLVEVLDGLLELPLPGDRLAPRLVRGSVRLWTP